MAHHFPAILWAPTDFYNYMGYFHFLYITIFCSVPSLIFYTTPSTERSTQCSLWMRSSQIMFNSMLDQEFKERKKQKGKKSCRGWCFYCISQSIRPPKCQKIRFDKSHNLCKVIDVNTPKNVSITFLGYAPGTVVCSIFSCPWFIFFMPRLNLATHRVCDDDV